MEEKRGEFNKELEEILDPGPDRRKVSKGQVSKERSEVHSSGKRREIPQFVEITVRIAALSTAVFLLMLFAYLVSSR